MGKTIGIDGLADTVMEELNRYQQVSTKSMKKAVKDAGKTVKSEISSGAPVKSGRYARSWTSKTTAESATGMQVTVYSPSRYMLAHLLEHGHALRNGGRARAFPHIAPAEEQGIKQLEQDIERAFGDG